MISFSLVIHKWTGLFTAVFLAIAGLTGSLLAFEDELEALINPALSVVQPARDAQGRPVPMLDPFVLHAAAEAALPGYRITGIPFLREPYSSVMLNVQRVGKELADADQAFFDPYTGRLLGTRKWGASLFDSATAVGFIYRIHYALALPEPWGKLFFGIVALVWTVNCIVGLISTLPRKGPLLSRWAPAWIIKRGGSTFRLHFDIHRASGLWLWSVLFLFAWSSVMLNLRSEVYTPVMSTFLDFKVQPSRPPTAAGKPALDWPQAYRVAQQAMDQVARDSGFSINFPSHLFYNRGAGAFVYFANTSRDVSRERGQTAVYIDQNTGALLTTRIPTGDHSGDTASRWLQSLHMAKVFGLPYRIFVALIGLAIAISAYTGLYIWWKKRQVRLAKRKRPASPALPAR